MESVAKKGNPPTESMYAKAATLLFVDNGGKMSVKQAMNFAGFAESDCNMDKHRSTVNRRKRRLVKQGSAALRNAPPTSIIVVQPTTPLSTITGDTTLHSKTTVSAAKTTTQKFVCKTT